MSAGARFCHHCGAAASGGAPGATPSARGGIPQAWLIAVGVLVVLVAFVAGQQFMGQPGSAASAAPAGGAVNSPGTTDISNMSPEEAASRLFDRVMRYASEGKADSAAMFAPMAIVSYERIGPLDTHARYDVGMISAVIGDGATAGAQADTILKAQPDHLLALLLAATAADVRKDAVAAAKYRARFMAAAPAERARKLKEYVDHNTEIEKALGKAAAAKK